MGENTPYLKCSNGDIAKQFQFKSIFTSYFESILLSILFQFTSLFYAF